jgi:enterochelin esterase-like enzyme
MHRSCTFSFILFFCIIYFSLPLCAQKNNIDSLVNKNIQLSAGKIFTTTISWIDSLPDRKIHIWVPNNYKQYSKMNVLYMHDAQMLFDASTTWNKQEWELDETIQRLIDAKQIAPTIVVGIENISELRYTEYFPKKVLDVYLKTPIKDSLLAQMKNATNADRYLSYIVKKIRPFVIENFDVDSNYQHTYIGGSSMGGLISMYAITQYPQIFGGAICMSTHWPGGNPSKTYSADIGKAFNTYLQDHLPNNTTHKFYFDYGTNTLDSFYAPYQDQIDKTMFKHHFGRQNWMTKKFKGAAHDETSWAKRFFFPLMFLMNNQSVKK